MLGRIRESFKPGPGKQLLRVVNEDFLLSIEEVNKIVRHCQSNRTILIFSCGKMPKENIKHINDIFSVYIGDMYEVKPFKIKPLATHTWKRKHFNHKRIVKPAYGWKIKKLCKPIK